MSDCRLPRATSSLQSAGHICATWTTLDLLQTSDCEDVPLHDLPLTELFIILNSTLRDARKTVRVHSFVS